MIFKMFFLFSIVPLLFYGCNRRNYYEIKNEPNELIEHLNEYKLIHSSFPTSLDILEGGLDGIHTNGMFWNRWSYFSDGETFQIFTYPDRFSRTRVIFKSSGLWYIDDESGDGPVKMLD